jgi:MinD-like ATPase involved in chromosome partitioning or flagellar assembly
MTASQCVDSEFDAIFIDDVCSFLTPRLITLLRQRGRSVIGVFDNGDGPDAKRHLLDCGISDVIESGATAEEFLTIASSAARSGFDRPPDIERSGAAARAIAVVGAIDGVGVTEVAVTLASLVALRIPTVLADLDPAFPSVAQRLDLPAHPNLRTLIDAALRNSDIGAGIQSVGGMSVVTGSPWLRSANQIPSHEVTMALGRLVEHCQVLIADMGGEERLPSPVFKGFEVILVVASGDPIGLTRLIQMRDRLVAWSDHSQVVLILNRAPSGRFYESEIRNEVAAALGGMPTVFLPSDDRLSGASWQGRPAIRGGFARQVTRVADVVIGAR